MTNNENNKTYNKKKTYSSIITVVELPEVINGEDVTSYFVRQKQQQRQQQLQQQ